MEVPDSSFNIGPCGILREDCPDDNFKPPAAGPPALRAVKRVEPVVNIPHFCGAGAILRRALFHCFVSCISLSSRIV